ncbi:hypothetical protein VB773_01295 [Haloarculaceae archaeon H-GB2-1]|nr:hypothetical protein [Haloarculaceae archaeon H-GB1-1]MEA5388305.1 hypothetical protein [Haloarculaceae archaeon H-GB11]MEA5406350.1 hypothetical protein [Haloarculaceae archaeon H-GB2-1]
MDTRPFELAGWTLAVFAVVGIGLGLTGYVTTDFALGAFAADGSATAQTVGQLFAAIVAFLSLIIVFFLGPLVAMVTGLIAGSVVWEPTEAVIAGGLGSFVGFYIMLFLSVPLLFVALDASGGSGTSSSAALQLDPGSLLAPVAIAGLPTGLVGAVTAVIGNQIQ